ncbi:uncharacterized protein LOC131695420 [Topomyia yanbarensis]|uniref:uncharacterized protein LOC131694576 n=1 Tax=Topomyia yanbarensis TaxID=2498891 RepID=UPI00273B1F1C|nr:uncharacterized protein LOC131694576 [Topomyia yanbarensis]XP_058839893.1 uncharacterized protein LOC131695420 [Topomyia yanbarensis]
MVWTRPADVPYPSVWHTFKAKALDSDELVSYVVQDLPEDRFVDGINHMLGIFIYDEPMCRAKKLADEQASVDDIRDMWREVVKQRLALVCFREGSDEIVGLNMTFASCVDDRKDYVIHGDRWRDVHDAVMFFTEQSRVHESFHVDAYLSAMGLSVSPKYRGRGIATEILRARIPLCRAVGLKVTSTVFTAPGSQAPAVKVGFKDTFVMAYDELAKMEPRFEFPDIQGRCCKSMTLRID